MDEKTCEEIDQRMRETAKLRADALLKAMRPWLQTLVKSHPR